MRGLVKQKGCRSVWTLPEFNLKGPNRLRTVIISFSGNIDMLHRLRIARCICRLKD